MNAEQRAGIVEDLIDEERKMIDIKGAEYTGGADTSNDLDTLANFKRVAERTGLHPFQVWAVYFLKHIDSIQTYVQDVANNVERERSEPITGRIVDARTYLGLLECLRFEFDPEPDLPGLANSLIASDNHTPLMLTGDIAPVFPDGARVFG